MKKDLAFIIICAILAAGFVYTGFEYEEPIWFYVAAGTGFFAGGVLWLLNYYRNKNTRKPRI